MSFILQKFCIVEKKRKRKTLNANFSDKMVFDKLHAKYIISFIHLLEIHLFTYSLNFLIYLFIYLSDQTFIHLTFEYNIFCVIFE